MSFDPPIDLYAEMAAARERRTTSTQTAIRDARVLAVRTALRPGSNDEDLASTIAHFYPKLSEEKRAEVAEGVRAKGIRTVSGPVDADLAPDEDGEATAPSDPNA
jgi:hypothetical protein